MRRRAGIKDVADHAGVGISTVSRVLSGSATVKPELARRVLAAAAELGYQPDMLAQSLRRGATLSVGFIADDLSNHLNIDIATGAEGALRAERYSLLVMNSEMEPHLDAVNIRVLQARRVDALMMTPVTEDDPELIDALGRLDIPVVVIEGDLVGHSRVSFVVSDHRAGAALALRHLLSLGHRRVTMITGPNDFRSARQRRLAVDDVAAECGPGIVLTHVSTELNYDGARDAASSALGGTRPPTAIVAGGGQLLTGVLDVAAARELGIGTELSLVATDPVDLARFFRPPLAAVSRDPFGLGRHAARILLRAIADADLPPQRKLLPTFFTPRESVGPPPGR